MAVVRRDDPLIFGRDGLGQPVDIGALEYTTEGGGYYTRPRR